MNPVDRLIGWSVRHRVAVLVLTAIARLRGNPWYALAVLWGLVGVYVAQHASNLDGAAIAADAALGLAATTLVVSLWHLLRRAAPAKRSGY